MGLEGSLQRLCQRETCHHSRCPAPVVWLSLIQAMHHSVPIIKDAHGAGGDQFYHTQHILTARGLVPKSFGWCGSSLHPYPSGRSHLGRELEMHTGLQMSISAGI